MGAKQGWMEWLFGTGKEKGPEIPRPSEMAGGHRGVAMGDRAAPDRSAENVAQWEQLTGNEVEDFVLNGKPFPVHSSNVAGFKYDLKRQVLTVSFLAKRGRPGGVYEYYDVTPQEAIHMAKALSKGSAVWDTLRIRGTRTGHRKKYRRLQ